MSEAKAEADGRRTRRRPSMFSAAASTFGTNLAVACLSLLNVLIVARTLGPAGRGDVAFLIALATLTSHVGTLGVHEANANLAGAEPGLKRRLATNSLVLALAFGLATVAVYVALVTLFPIVGGNPARVLLWVTVGSIPFLILRRYLTLLVQADYRFGVTNVAWVIGPVTSLAVNGVLVALGSLSVATAIFAWIAGQALGTLVLVVSVARRGGFGRPDRRLAGRSLGFGLKTHVGRFMTLGNYRVDQLFVGTLAGSRELGLYSVAVAWAEVLFYLPGVLVMVQRPDLVRATRERAASIAIRVLRVALMLALVFSAFLVVAAPLLCTTVFGEPFRGSVDDLRVLALGAAGIVTLELLGNALTAQRRPMLTTSAIAIAFVVTIVLDVVLIPVYGGFGAAIATTIAWTAGGAAAALIFTRAFGSRPRDLVPRVSDLVWFSAKLRSRFSGASVARDAP